jgi:hypothetical protein
MLKKFQEIRPVAGIHTGNLGLEISEGGLAVSLPLIASSDKSFSLNQTPSSEIATHIFTLPPIINIKSSEPIMAVL